MKDIKQVTYEVRRTNPRPGKIGYVQGTTEPSVEVETRDGQRIVVETKEQALELAERRCRAMFDRSYEDAIGMLDRGELHGTIAEVEVEMLRDMVRCFE